MRTNAMQRRAFTLVELLVVIAIIGVLVGLLLPAVQAAREAARRMSCQNNLKQHGLAMHNYHDTHNGFAPGYLYDITAQGNPATDEMSQWGWGMLIMPFMEQGPMHDQLGGGAIPLSAALTPGGVYDRSELLKTALSPFICPSDSGDGVLRGSDSSLRDAAGTIREAGKSNYVGVNTTRRWHSGGRMTGPDAGMPSRWSPPTSTGSPNGIFMRNRSVRFSDISDGTSNTLMIGERPYEMNTPTGLAVCKAGAWAGNDINNEQLTITRTLGSLVLTMNGPTAADCQRGFASPHPGGVLFVRADGGVSFISETIDHRPWGVSGNDNVDSVLERLGSRNDGQPTGE
ncbi:hypothetical protein FF011L_21490 [Roseimaritima multifibrata]|uniref:DUF1559 domain-containing protein n=1 Tax=Roseimaritima multifibrata TaxID=1930274 RepID=A0A517MER5_9BACT|nr:DUF1559 domain-containing protein [Roseimaritima multifibrata]QDS93384.1 hypothetical protein FF011L_21490 [Roseimaritima multifibrata]